MLILCENIQKFPSLHFEEPSPKGELHFKEPSPKGEFKKREDFTPLLTSKQTSQ